MPKITSANCAPLSSISHTRNIVNRLKRIGVCLSRVTMYVETGGNWHFFFGLAKLVMTLLSFFWILSWSQFRNFTSSQDATFEAVRRKKFHMGLIVPFPSIPRKESLSRGWLTNSPENFFHIL
jgi:hypothetical protein